MASTTPWATALLGGGRMLRHRRRPRAGTTWARWAPRQCLHAATVTDPRELRGALRTALDHRGPSLVDVRTDPNALSVPPHITAEQVRGFALAGMRTVLAGGVGKMVDLARSNRARSPATRCADGPSVTAPGS